MLVKNDFTYIEARSVSEAVKLRAKFGADSTFIAGGTNLLYLMKRGVRSPTCLIDIKGIEGLNSIGFSKEGDRFFEIGGLANLDTLSTSIDVAQNYPMISDCARGIASPQIRNSATLGGNLSQEVWCWYLTEGFDCWMNGGKHCFAPGGDNRYHHSVAGGFICLAIHPSDLAPVLYALDARVSVAGASYEGEKEIGIDELLPGFTKVEGKLKQNTLRSDELITKVRIPPPGPNSRGVFLKFAARGSFDFALCSVAVWIDLENESSKICKNARIVFGGVATKPYRAFGLESSLKGHAVSRDFLQNEVLASNSEKIFDREIPLSMNSYRISLARELARKALFQVFGILDE